MNYESNSKHKITSDVLSIKKFNCTYIYIFFFLFCYHLPVLLGCVVLVATVMVTLMAGIKMGA